MEINVRIYPETLFRKLHTKRFVVVVVVIVIVVDTYFLSVDILEVRIRESLRLHSRFFPAESYEHCLLRKQKSWRTTSCGNNFPDALIISTPKIARPQTDRRAFHRYCFHVKISPDFSCATFSTRHERERLSSTSNVTIFERETGTRERLLVARLATTAVEIDPVARSEGALHYTFFPA